jgi:hypothetical protein
MEACWFASLRLFLGCIRAQIEVDNSFVLPFQREHNSYIMDAVLESGQFMPIEIDQINYCHLFLQAVMVLYLTLADGVQLNPGNQAVPPAVPPLFTR